MYEIILYDTEDERCPVQELLDSLEPKLLAKTLRTIDLLEMNGPLLREPYSKPLENMKISLWISTSLTKLPIITQRESLRNEAPKGGRGSFENSGWQR